MDIKELQAEVRKVAAERPNETLAIHYFYCTPFEVTATPKCLIGNAMHNLGFNGMTFTRDQVGEMITDLARFDGFEWLNDDESTLSWLNDVQSLVDRDWAWGAAVDIVDGKR